MAGAFSGLFTSMVRGNLAEKRERHKTERSVLIFLPPVTRKKLLPFFSVFPLGSASAIVTPQATQRFDAGRSAPGKVGEVDEMAKPSDSLPVRATSLKGISKMYGLGKSTLRKAINEGRLRAIRIGRRTVVRIADADAFIAGGEEISGPQSRGNSSAKARKGAKR
jgi:excisionase family DNA binding protein